jgi:hypothetical protein
MALIACGEIGRERLQQNDLDFSPSRDWIFPLDIGASKIEASMNVARVGRHCSLEIGERAVRVAA